MRTPIRLLTAILFATLVLAACTAVPQDTYPVSVTLDGSGSGSVASVVSEAPFDHTDIDTDAGVFESDFGQGWTISLVAEPDEGSSFDGFSGADCEDGTDPDTCQFTVDSAKDVTATFEAATAPLEVTVNTGGNAEGSVVSSPGGIDTASGDTQEDFDIGETVTLTATVDAESFAGWTGGQCEGVTSLTCDVTIESSMAPIAANFNEAETLVVQIAAETDTAEQFLSDSLDDPDRWPDGHTYTFSNDLELGYDPQHGPQAIGLRFPNVTIPVDANIVDAELELTAFAEPDTDSGTDLAVTITGEASTSSSTFVGDSNGSPGTPGSDPASSGVTSLTQTSASVDWTVAEAWTDGVAYASPDTASIVREIVGLSGWASGGSLVFIVEPSDDTSTAYRRAYASAVSGSETDAPTLTVEYVTLP